MSPTAHTILSSRRAYEYPIDDIRLSIICTSVVQNELTKVFGFQSAVVAPPPDIFGEVRPTTPPGLILQVGDLKGAEVVPIRAVMFDSRRVIIDVAAPSSAIDKVKRKVDAVLDRFKAQKDQPILTKPIATWDQSDIVVKAKLPNSLGLSSRAWEALSYSIPRDLTQMVSLRVVCVAIHSLTYPWHLHWSHEPILA